MTTIFLGSFVKNVPELLIPFAKALVKKKAKKADLTPVNHAFNKIDEFIED